MIDRDRILNENDVVAVIVQKLACDLHEKYGTRAIVSRAANLA